MLSSGTSKRSDGPGISGDGADGVKVLPMPRKDLRIEEITIITIKIIKSSIKTPLYLSSRK